MLTENQYATAQSKDRSPRTSIDVKSNIKNIGSNGNQVCEHAQDCEHKRPTFKISVPMEITSLRDRTRLRAQEGEHKIASTRLRAPADWTNRRNDSQLTRQLVAVTAGQPLHN